MLPWVKLKILGREISFCSSPSPPIKNPGMPPPKKKMSPEYAPESMINVREAFSYRFNLFIQFVFYKDWRELMIRDIWATGNKEIPLSRQKYQVQRFIWTVHMIYQYNKILC